jgi:hypothetical protein
MWLIMHPRIRHAARAAILAALLPTTGCAQEAGSGQAAGQEPRPPPTASTGLPSGALRVERAVIVDASGFEEPMVAATLFLPHGWQARGGVQWGQQFACTNGYVFDWSATSPDGLASIAVLPQERWEWNNIGAPPATPGCPAAPHRNVQPYLQGLAQRLRPGARVLDYRARPDLRQEFVQYESVTPMPLGESRVWVEAGELVVGYQEKGQDMRGSVAAVVVFNLMRTDAGMGVMEALSGATFPAFAACAPSEQFNAGFFEALRRSIKVDPRWESRISGHNATLARIALRENKKRSEIMARTHEEIARIREEAWNSYQQCSDRRFREFGELLRGVETDADPESSFGQIELSSLYDSAWRLDDGSYVLTNDVSFDPYRALGVAGKKLDAVK